MKAICKLIDDPQEKNYTCAKIETFFCRNFLMCCSTSVGVEIFSIEKKKGILKIKLRFANAEKSSARSAESDKNTS